MSEKISDEVKEAIKKELEIDDSGCAERFFERIEKRLANKETHWLTKAFQTKMTAGSTVYEPSFNQICREIVEEWMPDEETAKTWWWNAKEGSVDCFLKAIEMLRNGEKFE